MAETGATFVVRLRVAATLRHRLPAFGDAKEIEVRLPLGADVQSMARAVGLDVAQMGLVCAVNGQVVRAEATLKPGDEVRLMLPLAGG
jgi:hypothetical protein